MHIHLVEGSRWCFFFFFQIYAICYFGFHPIPLGVLGKRREEEEKKRKEKGEIVENQAHFSCPPKSILCCYTYYLHQYAQSCIAILSINSRSTCNCCSALFSMFTPLHPLTCPHFLQTTLHTSGHLKISLFPGQLSLKQHLHFQIVCWICSFVICHHLLCISVCLQKNR